MFRLNPFPFSVLFPMLCAACATPPSPETSPSAPPVEASRPKNSEKPTETAAPKPNDADLVPLYERVVGAADRSPTDRALDVGRKPVEMMTFYHIEPGMKIAELAAGGGYTAELLARVVGPSGEIYGQNTPLILERFAEKPWSERLEKPVMANVQRIDSEMEDPLPGHQADLDAVFLVLFYHDTVWFETDRDKMNMAVYAALKPGGIFAVVDHSAREGQGVTVAQSLHRIEEKTLIDEVEKVGFVLEKSADFLRNPDDERDWNASPSQAGDRRGQSDRFVLLFRKPVAVVGGEAQPSKKRAGLVTCTDPRSAACTKEFNPVCATVDTGIRCIKAPCPSVDNKTYNNGCLACADPKVMDYVPGACKAGSDQPAKAHLTTSEDPAPAPPAGR